MTDEELTRRFDGIDERFAGVDRRFDAVDQRFDGMDQRFDHLEAFVREEVAQFKAFVKEEGLATRRHFDVVAEAMKAEVKVIAEGHDALRDRDAAQQVGLEQLGKQQERLEDRQLALEYRQRKLEDR